MKAPGTAEARRSAEARSEAMAWIQRRLRWERCLADLEEGGGSEDPT